MKVKFVFLFIASLAVTSYVRSQAFQSRFIVGLGHFTQQNLADAVIRCVGTIISPQHILAPASCVIVQPPTEIAVNFVSTTILPGGENSSASTLVPASRVFVHPFYEKNGNSNNAAIVMSNIVRDNPNWGFAPRLLGSLSTLGICNLFGWGGELLDPPRDAVSVYNAEFCDPNSPQTFCSIFDSTSHSTCTARLGSPLTCANDLVVAGFVTNEEGCSWNSNRAMLTYHSVGDLYHWIEGVFGPELPERDPVNFIVNVLEFLETSITDALPRCFGTIISSNRVLTTAICATVQSPLKLAVLTRRVSGSSSSSQSYRTSRIYIHPRYVPENPLSNNVAIIEIDGSFEEIFVPRLLGSIQPQSSCQLFGWGATDFRFTRGDNVTLYGSENCNPNFPQAFCSSHSSIFHYTCAAMTGSPITCGNESVIAGFLINNASCSESIGHATLNYHSVSQFADWILNPSAAVANKISVIFIVFVVLIKIVIN
ncbi:Granzyme M [Pseudolycoriella hygida]|uniref:Granzyme M n=1 Tax=Pseudolycoriella hygida TaxID=35572 RepID=A0A9Q0S373_9DIPT|nr:Granzyme M [Pseudolycoriella hygida]